MYSGHDVSLLAVLHALRAPQAHDETFWPDYATTIEFEVLEDVNQEWFVRIRMNGEVLPINGKTAPLSLEELNSLLQELYIPSDAKKAST